MSLTGKNKVDTNKYELSIHVDAESFEKACEKAYRKNVKKINIPGFRAGKAPRKTIEKLYGDSFFFEEAVNDLYPSSLREAVEEAELELVAPAEVEAKEVSKENGIDFVAICVVRPEVSVKDYKGIEAVKTLKKIGDKEVNERIDAMRNRNARLVDVTDRPSKKGDSLIFDFDGYVDGIPFEGGKAEKFSLEIGSGQFIPGFEEQLEGKKLLEEFEVNVTFPESYHAEELKGKAAMFRCKIHEIKEKELPELDDEFAKDVSEFDTLDELKADIQKKMQEQSDKAASDALENKLIDKVIENMEAEIPNEMYEARIDEMIRDFEYRLQSQGMNLESYLQYTGMDRLSFRQTFEEQAQRQVKIRLALEKIVELEAIEASEEEIEAEYDKVAENYKMDKEKVKSLIPVKGFVMDIQVNKAIDLVRDSAKITEKAEESEE